MLEDGDDSIAPPPRRRAAAPVALLPDRPAFADSAPAGALADSEDAEAEDAEAEYAEAEAAEAEDAEAEDAEAEDAEAEDADAEDADAEDADVEDADAADAEDADADAEEADADDVVARDADSDDATVEDAGDLDTTMHAGSHTDGDDAAHGGFRTPSPKPHGASRIDGGIIRGRANGNVFNFGDVDMDHVSHQTRPKVVGRVLVYDDRKSDEPSFSIKQEVTDDLKEILTCLGDKHSPVRSA
jgi:hypothetical protein